MSKSSCPSCNSIPCYISFMGKIECSNEKCIYYSSELYPKEKINVDCFDENNSSLKKEEISSEKEDEDQQNEIMFYWSMYHTDCG